jgi:hypothetical protein
MAKSIHDYTRQTILVVCFTNHALDDILTSLLDIGIPASSMVRLGGKSTPRTEPLTLQQQGNVKYRRDKWEWEVINEANSTLNDLEGKLTLKFDEYMANTITHNDILGHLRSEGSDYFFAFTIPSSEEGMQIIGSKGRTVKGTYLLERWLKGQDGGIFRSSGNVQSRRGIWDMDPAKRKAKSQEWYHALEAKQVRSLYSTIKSYNQWTERLKRTFEYKDISLIRGKRIIGCTTTAAAKYGLTIQAAAPDVVLVEEAGEILESHILTALGSRLKQLILIGDHKCVRSPSNLFAFNSDFYQAASTEGQELRADCREEQRLRPQLLLVRAIDSIWLPSPNLDEATPHETRDIRPHPTTHISRAAGRASNAESSKYHWCPR